MATATCTPRSLCQQWRRQLLSRLDSHIVEARKKFVAMTFVNLANTQSSFVDIENLRVVLLYEDSSRHEAPIGRWPLRFAGYRLSRAPHGLQWGGERNSAFFKNLLLAPKAKAYGQRMDRFKTDLLALALKLDRRLTCAARHSAAPWPAFHLPKLWAGFQQRHTSSLRFAGPEFDEASRHYSRSGASSIEVAARSADGLVLYPLDWVSGQLGLAKAIFAETTPTIKRRVFRVTVVPGSLTGFQGASGFDLFNSRYRDQPWKRKGAKRYRKHCPSKINATHVSPVNRNARLSSV